MKRTKPTAVRRALRAHPQAHCVYQDPLGNVYLSDHLHQALSLWGGDASQLDCYTRGTTAKNPHTHEPDTRIRTAPAHSNR